MSIGEENHEKQGNRAGAAVLQNWSPVRKMPRSREQRLWGYSFKRPEYHQSASVAKLGYQPDNRPGALV